MMRARTVSAALQMPFARECRGQSRSSYAICIPGLYSALVKTPHAIAVLCGAPRSIPFGFGASMDSRQASADEGRVWRSFDQDWSCVVDGRQCHVLPNAHLKLLFAIKRSSGPIC